LPVTRLARRLLGWRTGDVEDVVHDVFLAALTKRQRFRGDASPWTWLVAITINRCRSHRRRQLVRLKWWRAAGPAAETTDDREPSIERSEMSMRVRDAVTALPARDREVVVLYYLEEMTVAQVAAVVGASTGAVEVRLHRARAKLRQLLGSAGLE
jgi:RNA polymerase sigma-70 factor (ECF subfamily)